MRRVRVPLVAATLGMLSAWAPAFAASSPPPATTTGTTATGTTATAPSALDTAVVQLALKEVGRPYVWGGTSPAGFDCSGLVQWVFAHEGVFLPRLSGQQYRATTRITKSQLEPGDLVFFQTYKAGPSHVGIYIGSDNGIAHAFVAADNPAVGVEIDNLDTAKWTRLYYGAGRLPASLAATAQLRVTQQGTTGTGSGQGTSTGTTGTTSGPSTSSSTAPSALDTAAVQLALKEVGRPYVWGGTSPAGFDCSGLVQWVFAHEGVFLPRLSGQQYRATTRITKSQLEPGDLVFFQTYKPGPSHVGIYIGSDNGIAHAFVAADNPAVGVEIDNLDTAKWTRLYYGAGRVTG